MSAYNMETLEKSDRINYIRDAFKKAMHTQSKFMTGLTVNSKWEKFRDDKIYYSKPKLIKLYNEIWEHNKDMKSVSVIKKVKKEIKEQNSKIKSVVGARTKHDKKALGNIFKKSFITDFVNQSFEHVIKRIEHKLKDEYDANNKKYNLIAYIVFIYEITNKDDEKVTKYYHSETMYITSKNIIVGYMEETKAIFLKELEVNREISSSVFDKFLEIQISTARNKAIAGKSFIELPLWVKNKRCCVNIKNKDDMCFKWSLLAYKHFDNIKSKDRNETYNYKKYWDTIVEPDDVSYPVKLNDIYLWEKANNLKINVIKIIDGEQDFKNEYTTNTFNENVVNLLLIEDGDSAHYVWVKNINGLYASKTTHTTKYVCSQCLCKSFSTHEMLEEHIKHKLCQSFNAEKQPCKLIMPKEGENVMQFRGHNNEFMHPFHVIADFESTLEKVEDDKNKFTQKYQQHVQNSYGLKYSCIHDQYSEPIQIFNSSDPEEVSKTFIEDLERLAEKSYQLTQLNKTNIKISDKENKKHLKADCCEKCLQCFAFDYDKENKNMQKVRHHDHISGKFIGSYCNGCNLQYQYKRFLPVYLHNLKGYDSHLFVKSLFKYGYKPEDGVKQKENITCIPNNEERYISFSKLIKVDEYTDKEKIVRPVMYEIRFLDTLSFMATSIDSLSENLKKDCKTIEQKREVFKNVSEQFDDDNEFEMMIKKGIYPYDYIDKYARLHETNLPPQKSFDSILNNSQCSDKAYEQAKLVWDTFDCKTMMDYHNLYLITDVLLLADIWANFRNVCYKNYGLDCVYYYTAPSLSFDAMLKYTKIKLELLTDIEMFEFVESGIRGGISQISTRHAVANNKYMKEYDESKEDSYIVYLDANNLYGGAMCEYLPYKDFKWNSDEWDKDKIMSIGDKDEIGYLFSVDLSIDESLHDHMNNYPPCPENISIEKSFLSDWQQESYRKSNIKKLCCTFFDKKDYVVNYRYLKLVLSLGVKLEKVNKVLQYEQKAFLKDYIMLNTNLRKASKNEFEKDFYKLMNNSVFGKTMENVRNRINFKLINTEKQALNVKNMKRFTIFNDDLVGLHLNKNEVKLCKPIYLGQNILDDSKLTMYDFHYNFMLKKVKRENIDLLFTDTDSLCYHIRKQDIFEIIKENNTLFDLSNYPKDHELYDDTNNKALGKFKNESPTQISEFIGLRAKLYTFSVDGEKKSHNKCKGVKSCVAKNEITIDDYRNTLYSRNSKSVMQNGIRSYQHEIYTEKVRKIALSCNDDKVHILDNNIYTVNHGHYSNTKIIGIVGALPQ
jgi:hypothetical protein